MKNAFVAPVVAALFALPACDRPQDTLQTLQNEVSAYASHPSDESAEKIDARFAKLDAQIGKLRHAGQSDEADRFSRQRDALQTQYAAARMTASLLKAKEAAANVGEAFRKAGEAFGQAFQAGATNAE